MQLAPHCAGITGCRTKAGAEPPPVCWLEVRQGEISTEYGTWPVRCTGRGMSPPLIATGRSCAWGQKRHSCPEPSSMLAG